MIRIITNPIMLFAFTPGIYVFSLSAVLSVLLSDLIFSLTAIVFAAAVNSTTPI